MSILYSVLVSVCSVPTDGRSTDRCLLDSCEVESLSYVRISSIICVGLKSYEFTVALETKFVWFCSREGAG